MTILHIDTSINGDNSASRQLTKSLVEKLKSAQWGEEVVYRDLAANPIPHLTLRPLELSQSGYCPPELSWRRIWLHPRRR